MQPTRRPPVLWFLDIDGVVNSRGEPRSSTLPYQRVEVCAGGSWTIWFCRVIVERINALHRAGLVDIRWLTTWDHTARTEFAPAVGLDAFHVMPNPHAPELADKPVGDPRPWWKLALASTRIARDPSRPFIWTDDELPAHVKDELRARFPDTPSRLLSPAANPGLTVTHLNNIEAFARRHRA